MRKSAALLVLLVLSASLAFAGGSKETSSNKSREKKTTVVTTQKNPVAPKPPAITTIVQAVPLSGPVATPQESLSPNAGSAPALTIPSTLVTVSSPSSGPKNPGNTSVSVSNQPTVTPNLTGSVSIVTPLGTNTQTPVAGGVIVTSTVRVDVLPSYSGAGGSTVTSISQFVPISGYTP